METKWVTIVAIIVLIGFVAFYVHFPVSCDFRLLTKSLQTKIKVPAGFGGGVIIVEGNRKQFVTMVQRTMFSLTPEGYIPVPDGTKRIWIDVGSHATAFNEGGPVYGGVYWPDRTTKSVTQEFKDASDIYGIAIDPNSRFYEPLSKIPRLLPIIAAIYTVEGTQLFYEYPTDGCSSLLEPNSKFDARYHGVAGGCYQVKQMTGVSTIRLETILALIDPRLSIQLLKIDAQGVDLEVIQSCGSQLKRVEKIIIETQKQLPGNSSANMLYKNQISAEDSVVWMKKNGFAFNEKQSSVNNKAIEEHNYVFDNLHLEKKL